MGEQKKSSGSSRSTDISAELSSSIANVQTLPKAVYRGEDAIKMCEGLKKGDDKNR